MKRCSAVLLTLLIAGCDLTSGSDVEERIRADALSRASSDCSAARSCRVAITKQDGKWVVAVLPTALGISGDPQFNSGVEHHYQYDASGVFEAEIPE